MTKKRILVISDSLGLPRENPDGMVYFNETWPYLLKEKYQVVHLGIGGATIGQLVDQAAYYRFAKPDIVILQSGIVDCAPRTLTKNEKEFWLNFPLINKLVFRLIYKFPNQIRKIRNISLTPPNEFEAQIIKLKNLFKGIPVFALSILEATPEYELLVPGISARINFYNKLLKKVFEETYIDLVELIEMGICSDYHHLNIVGHEKISIIVLEKLTN